MRSAKAIERELTAIERSLSGRMTPGSTKSPTCRMRF
jgi:hypothetical protein